MLIIFKCTGCSGTDYKVVQPSPESFSQFFIIPSKTVPLNIKT